MEIRRIFNMPISQILPSLRFREKLLAALFSDNNIRIRTIPHHLIGTPDFYKSTMRLIDLHTYPEVGQFTGFLVTLGVKDLWFKISSYAQQKTIAKQRLFSDLGSYIKEGIRAERMLISLHNKKQWAMETLSPEDIKNSTVYPGERHLMVAQIAEILTRVVDPRTRNYFLDTALLKTLPTEKKATLDGVILEALSTFKRVYMEESQPDGSLGTFEWRRIFTMDIGLMLTQLIRPGTNSPYLDPGVFYNLPYHQQTLMAFGSPNPIYEAFKDFLRINRPRVKKEENVCNILTAANYELVKDKWEKLLMSNNVKRIIDDLHINNH